MTSKHLEFLTLRLPDLLASWPPDRGNRNVEVLAGCFQPFLAGWAKGQVSLKWLTFKFWPCQPLGDKVEVELTLGCHQVF